MLNAGVLTFREFAMREQLPLAEIQAEVLEFLRNRDDVVVFGAQAVNAWVDEPRMTQNIDLLALEAGELAEEIRSHLNQRFDIAVRVREVKTKLGYRVYQIQKAGNRHLVDIRAIAALPISERIEQVLVMAPVELLAYKVMAYYRRRGKPKAGTDWRDIAMLLLRFPQFQENPALVAERLEAAEATPEMISLWHELAQQIIESVDEDEDF
ncbi:MAG: nucleotidyl transferase AbiEii/AbiGii toxin family protein [Synechococcales cyanobacterium RM1_1_8]|nr:nucleotidyl transferase AbiEii/AbiGii toxin family protein [Synechococcales cyanobacterium RM1_1_8]